MPDGWLKDQQQLLACQANRARTRRSSPARSRAARSLIRAVAVSW